MIIVTGPKHRIRRPTVGFSALASGESTAENELSRLLAKPVSFLGLSVRDTNCLEDQGVFTIEDLSKMTADKLRALQNLGRITHEKCCKALDGLNVPHRLREGEENIPKENSQVAQSKRRPNGFGLLSVFDGMPTPRRRR